MGEGTWIRLARTDELEQGRPRPFEAAGRAIFACRVGEAFYCAENACSHADFPLSDGDVEEAAIICPLHGARFDLESGAPLTPPAEAPIRVFPTRVAGGELFVLLGEPGD